MSVLQASEEVSLTSSRASDQSNIEGQVSVSHSQRRRRGPIDAALRRAVIDRLKAIRIGGLQLVEPEEVNLFGHAGSGEFTTLHVKRDRFFRSLALQGALGAAESYIKGDFEADDLTAAMRVLARNAETLSSFESGWARLLRPLRSAINRWNSNSKSGSRKNISAHYDLSNDFFQLMLDPTMTYSSGVFPSATATMQEASIEKYDRICRKLELHSTDHLLEIGTGWGGFAEHAVKHYGCRVTTTTISKEQFEYAKLRFRKAGIANRVNLLMQDYRDLRGQFDKLASIEMIEAVGEKYLPQFFRQCSNLLKEDGAMCLQAITMPDHRYDRYRKSVDFIQRYIFPGGFLPSFGAIGRCLADQTDFRWFHSEDFGPHYARTLSLWREQFWDKIEAVRELGFDERFIRTWHYYLCYCEAGFEERQIGVSQLVLTKPASRLEPRTAGC